MAYLPSARKGMPKRARTATTQIRFCTECENYLPKKRGKVKVVIEVVKTDFSEDKEALQGINEPELGKGHAIADPLLPKWEIQRDRDKAIKAAVKLAQALDPHGEQRKFSKDYSDKAYVQTVADAKREYLLDSGASIDMVGADSVAEEENLRIKNAAKTLNINTANGKVTANETIAVKLPNLGIELDPLILKNCPNVLSMGKRCADEGFGFYWDPFSKTPRLIRPDGKVITCDYRGGVPIVPSHAFSLEAVKPEEEVYLECVEDDEDKTFLLHKDVFHECEAEYNLHNSAEPICGICDEDESDICFPTLKVGALFCDEKFNDQATAHGFEPGFAFDMRIGWDFTKRKVRDDAETRVRRDNLAS